VRPPGPHLRKSIAQSLKDYNPPTRTKQELLRVKWINCPVIHCDAGGRGRDRINMVTPSMAKSAKPVATKGKVEN
jgi:hypothetical protein